MVSNVIRCGMLPDRRPVGQSDDVGLPFFVLMLAAFSVNRFLLAGLSASLPHVVDRNPAGDQELRRSLCGSIGYLSGLGAAAQLHALTNSDPAVIEVRRPPGCTSAPGVAYPLPFLGRIQEKEGCPAASAWARSLMPPATPRSSCSTSLALPWLPRRSDGHRRSRPRLAQLREPHLPASPPTPASAWLGAAIITPTIPAWLQTTRPATRSVAAVVPPCLFTHWRSRSRCSASASTTGDQDLRRHHPAASRRRRLPGASSRSTTCCSTWRSSSRRSSPAVLPPRPSSWCSPAPRAWYLAIAAVVARTAVRRTPVTEQFRLWPRTPSPALSMAPVIWPSRPRRRRPPPIPWHDGGSRDEVAGRGARGPRPHRPSAAAPVVPAALNNLRGPSPRGRARGGPRGSAQPELYLRGRLSRPYSSTCSRTPRGGAQQRLARLPPEQARPN